MRMEGHARTWFTPKQKAELWERWKSGQCVADIARALERRNKSGVYRVLAGNGGIAPAHAGGLWERCGLRSAKRFRGALPPVGRYGGSHRASNDRPQLSAERSGVTAAAAPTAPARLISAPGGGHCAQSLVAWRAMPSYDGASRRSSCSSGRLSRSLAG